MNRKSFIDLSNDTHEAMGQLLLQKHKFPGWLATLAFYKSLSVVNLFVAPTHLRNDHRSRNDLLRSLYPQIYKPYRILFTASLIARYLRTDTSTYSSFSDYMTPDEVVSKLILKKLVSIEQQCISKLNSSEKSGFRAVSEQWVDGIVNVGTADLSVQLDTQNTQ